MKELGIYVHIPFCKRKCNYCDFVSCTRIEMQEKYVESLLKEIEYYKNKITEEGRNNFKVTTIYFGGGTPSIINERYIVHILNTIKINFMVDVNAEITIEVNPGTVTREKILMYKRAGINRISIGLQSTDDRILKELGRIHNFDEFLETYRIVRESEFENVNIDLMLGLPNQDNNLLIKSIEKVISLDPEHVSIYSLILEEGTKYKELVDKGELILPSDEKERDMYWKTKEYLESEGYNHYEISNFAKKGYESKHNSSCWEQEDYLGFGVAAHSYFCNKRYNNTDDIDIYIENINREKFEDNVTINEIQDDNDKMKEYMLLSLRKIEGVSISKFKTKFINNPLYLYRDKIEKLVNNELIEVDLDNIKLTKKGIDLANLVWEEFV